MDQCWQLAKLWYAGREEIDWIRGSAEETLDIFRQVGLHGSFWDL